MYYFNAKSNTPKQLKELARDGWYPGRKNMVMKQICIEAPLGMFSKDANLIDIRIISENLEQDRAMLFFGHRKFKAIKEGEPIPVVGKIVKNKNLKEKK